ncbi:hypothetical protein [Benzoatithermus flavus]|uniref:Lipoprotein n=1 Tax=Benzoatithermus flavus TaxID=3108223 RepID=A0ABU8XWU4_9PROT
MIARSARALLLPLVFAGCAASRPPGAPPISSDAANGQAIATVLGTPFYALFKATSCFVSTVIVVPSSAALALTERPQRDGEREALHEGLGHNCFGSYVLEPS